MRLSRQNCFRARICGALVCVALCAVPGFGATSQEDDEPSSVEVDTARAAEPAPTKVLSERDVARLETAQGVTLQWIGWENRGRIDIKPDANGTWQLAGLQKGDAGAKLTLAGEITEIGDGYFLLDGRIQIFDTPGIGRACQADRIWRFEVTENRAYYRLREFEWCDYLTDYVDIYFAPGLR